jgi:hypothetical protein
VLEALAPADARSARIAVKATIGRRSATRPTKDCGK